MLLDWYSNGNMINGVMAYFYLHDRLGSVRQIINTSGNMEAMYTYEPFGETLEEQKNGAGAPGNYFIFTGQYFDSEIDEYYLRARQYDPYIYRFTSRDPVLGEFKEPLTLHKYLYCANDPVNHVDPSGKSAYVSFVSGVIGSASSIMCYMAVVAQHGPHIKTAVITGVISVTAWGVFALDLAFEDLPEKIRDKWKEFYDKWTNLDYDTIWDILKPPNENDN